MYCWNKNIYTKKKKKKTETFNNVGEKKMNKVTLV